MTRNRQGFSLLETIVVILILGIMAGIAAPTYWVSIGNYRADLAQQQIISDLELAATTAKSQSSNQKIVFNGNSYYFKSFPATGNKAVHLDESPWFATLDSNQTEIVFNMYGSPLTQGIWTINKGTAYERTVLLVYPTGEIVK